LENNGTKKSIEEPEEVLLKNKLLELKFEKASKPATSEVVETYVNLFKLNWNQKSKELIEELEDLIQTGISI
jgi:DNA-directed RNA polymerase specialized sigma subunit